jgi:CRP-like cAMP-binding protein
VSIFAPLDPDDLEVLASTATLRRFNPDEVFCRQGELSDDVFLLLQGQVRAWILDKDGQPHALGDSREGACLGEMAVLDPAPRAATVSALTEGLVLVLQGRSFMTLLQGHPAIAEGVLRVLTRRLRGMIQAAS